MTPSGFSARALGRAASVSERSRYIDLCTKSFSQAKQSKSVGHSFRLVSRKTMMLKCYPLVIGQLHHFIPFFTSSCTPKTVPVGVPTHQSDGRRC